jgi:hypothetical protein
MCLNKLKINLFKKVNSWSQNERSVRHEKAINSVAY